MKKNLNNSYEINHLKKTITLTKKFLKAASILDTDEYKLFMKLREAHPNYKLKEKKIEKSASKQSYANLSISKMKAFIDMKYTNEKEKDKEKKAKMEEEKNEKLDEFDKMVSYYKTFHKDGHYGCVKSWFLDKYGDAYKKYEAFAKVSNSVEKPSSSEEEPTITELEKVS